MIRQLLPSDYHSYRDLRLQSRQSDPDSFISTYDEDANLAAHYFQDLISHATKPPISGIYGAFSNEATQLGHIQLSQETYQKQKHLVNIYELFTLLEYRRQHIAHDLIDYVINLSSHHSQIKQIHLKVHSVNQPAINLYKKLGFKHIATREKTIKEDTKFADELLFCYYL